MKNTEEQWNPNADMIVGKRSTYWCCGAVEVCRSLSDQEQVVAAALLVQSLKVEGGGRALGLRRREEEEEARRGKEKDPWAYL